MPSSFPSILSRLPRQNDRFPPHSVSYDNSRQNDDIITAKMTTISAKMMTFA